jgi:pyrroloquinoline quinone biosynthesis protein D
MTDTKTVDASGATTTDFRPKLAPLFRLQWEPTQDAHVLLYPEGMVKLNQSAGEILKRCDGTLSVDALIAVLEQAFETQGLRPDVIAFVTHARERGWLV